MITRPDGVWEPADVPQIVKDWLKTELAAPFPTLRVRMNLPADWRPGSDPVLVVANDGGPGGQLPVVSASTIRLTSWSTGRDVRFINRAVGLLLCRRIPGLATIRPGIAVFEARDSKNGADLASCTVRVRAKTVQAR